MITSYNDKDSNTFNGSNCKAISIYGQRILFIPNKLNIWFPNIDIKSPSLKELIKEDLAQFPRLKELWLYDNNLRSLPGDLFEGNPDILFINFIDNKPTNVGVRILTPLKELNQAYFDMNTCINQRADTKSDISSLVAALEANCQKNTMYAELKKFVCSTFKNYIHFDDNV